MIDLLELLRTAKSTGDYTPLLTAIPYARWLGLSYERQGQGWVTRLRYDEKLIGNPALPALHGGTLGALLESTAIYQLFVESETVSLPKTITLTIDYLRSAAPRDVFARGVITKLGRRVVTVRATAWQESPEKPVAMAGVHLLIPPVP